MHSLQDFNDAGITLWIEGDKLKYSAPKESLSPDVLAQLRAQKTHLMGELTHHYVGRLDDCSKDLVGKRYSRPGQFGRLQTDERLANSTDESIGYLQSAIHPPALYDTITGDRSQGYAALSTSLRQAEGVGTSRQPKSLVDFIRATQIAVDLDELYKLLTIFSPEPWELTERSNMSAGYTPVALKLIDKESKNKYMVLEDLAALCWNSHYLEAKKLSEL